MNAILRGFVLFLNSTVLFAPASAQIRAGELVINEFLASNSSYGSDQDGEFNDWVEIMNAADSTVIINGYYLTDDSVFLTKWLIPDTSLPSQSFLIIWCDRDSHQAGLHAGFKLNAAGERIFLVDPQQNIVDGLNFGPQGTDTSLGRCPDWTGNFSLQTPSIAASNLCTIGFEDTPNTPGFRVYPVPASEVLWIESSPGTEEFVTIYDGQGRAIANILPQNGRSGVPVADWPRGIYTARSSAGCFSKFYIE